MPIKSKAETAPKAPKAPKPCVVCGDKGKTADGICQLCSGTGRYVAPPKPEPVPEA